MKQQVAVVVLAVAVVVAVVGGARSQSFFEQARQAIKHDHAPRGLLDVQLVSDPARFRQIVEPWLADPQDHQTVVATLKEDDRFAWAYAATGLFLAAISIFFVGVPTSAPARVAVALVAVTLVAGALFDRLENRAIRDALANVAAVTSDDVHRIRDAALLKFASLLIGFSGVLILFLGAVRVILKKPPREQAQACRFADHVRREATEILSEERKDEPLTALNTPAEEPRVKFRSADVIGLALSGGGIRSATFNLGLLEGLHCRNLLPLFDYLSTVSGGGYVGSFWSAWLKRENEKQAREKEYGGRDGHKVRIYPPPSEKSGLVDAAAERHLREFSRFLAPRWGFFEIETWTAVVALVAGLIPAIAIGLSVIGLTILAWFALVSPIALNQAYHPRLITIELVSLVVFVIGEWMWFAIKKGSSAPEEARWWRWLPRWLFFCAITLVVLAVSHTAVSTALTGRFPGDVFYFLRGVHHFAPAAEGLERWWQVVGVTKPSDWSRAWVISPRVFEYALTWLLTGMLLIVGRLLVPLGIWKTGSYSATFDRFIMRLFGLSVLWAGIAVIWHAVMNIDNARTVVSGYLAGAAVSGGLFAALRNWIGVGLRKSDGDGVITRFKPYIPQILAYLTVTLLAVAVGRILLEIGGDDWFKWYGATWVMVLIAIGGLLIEPGEFGLHAFYRDRLARAFCGATNHPSYKETKKEQKVENKDEAKNEAKKETDAERADRERREKEERTEKWRKWEDANDAKVQDATLNRETDLQAADVIHLSELPSRPFHLVCCAANDLSGDTVATLGRGGRSAVLSKYGVAIGDYATSTTDLSLPAAITASAAAFNSNMGMVSKRVGPAVSFLMTMLNLRLGLWVRHPAHPESSVRSWPGLLLYREMFGQTSASGTTGATVQNESCDLHLSDGGHFENLGLYELVRRHCRYILVSDCGADPGSAFSDVGNALRRIREDFGLDITLDIEPLRADPVTGRSRQHVAIGTIHYSPVDRGILLVVKPTLTGDEPPDVRQYKTENSAFPHQTTGDQFYDEEQFESYRRLGLHVAEQVFSFVPPDPSVAPSAGAAGESPTADWVFAEAFHQWGPTPEGLEDRVLEMTARFGHLETELLRQNQSALVSEVFPEPPSTGPRIDLVDQQVQAGDQTEKEKAKEAARLAAEKDAASKCEVMFFVRVAQLMEDAWMACDLDDWWDHPLNLGWTNLFARWATAPSFRYWWPVICPMYSPGFRAFIDQRFPVPLPKGNMSATSPEIDVPQAGRVEQFDIADKSPGLSVMWWKTRSTQPLNTEGRTFYQNLVPLDNPRGDVTTLQLGVAGVKHSGTLAGWTDHDFFIPPSYWGAGYGWRFLDRLLLKLADEEKVEDCYVVVKAVSKDSHHRIAREDRVGFVRHYRKMGFRQLQPKDGIGPERTSDKRTFVDSLSFDEQNDVLLHLPMKSWQARRDTRSR